MQTNTRDPALTPMPKVRSKYLYYGPVFTAFITAMGFFGMSIAVREVFVGGQIHFWPLFVLVCGGIGMFWMARETYQNFLVIGRMFRLHLWGVRTIATLSLEDINIVGRESDRGFFWIERTIRFEFLNRKGQRTVATQTRLPGHLAEVILELRDAVSYIPIRYDPYDNKVAAIDVQRWKKDIRRGSKF